MDCLPKDVQRTGGIELKGQRDLLRLQAQAAPAAYRVGCREWESSGVCRIAVHIGDTAVDDRLVLRADALLVDLLDQRHDELRLYDNGVVFTVPVHHIHGIEPVSAASTHGSPSRDRP